MKKANLLLPVLFMTGLSYGQYQVKRIVFFTPGIHYGKHLVCGDTDNDSLNELIFNIDSYNTLQAWEYRPTNRYELVWQAVGGQPPPPGGILVGNFAPNDIGDIDRDGLTDLVGPNQEYENNKETTYELFSTQESPDSVSLPESLNWYMRFEYRPNCNYYADLDRDSLREILSQAGGIVILENTGNNQNEIVFDTFAPATAFATGDFDGDGKDEFVTAWASSLGRVFVYENIGDNQYDLVYVDTTRYPNGWDVFSGKDLDGDGKPEFFVSFAQYLGGNYWDYYLYMWETIGNNSYERILVDSYRIHNFTITADSKCGDLDGDGIEELVWSTTTQMRVYKAIGNNQFQLNWVWTNDHSNEVDAAKVNIYDMNNNGYNEIVFSGNGKISIFEIEAVRLLTPNGGQNFVSGDSVLIQWQKFYPPRCDSFSLSYTIDNGQTYQPILNSIPATESTYNWIVPNTPSESCRVKVTAYGPGTQFDESDALFTIQPSGLEEVRVIDQPLRLEIKPNPFKTKTTIRLNRIPNEELTLKIYNNAGAIVKTFVLKTDNQSALGGLIIINWDGKDNKGKRLPAGIYFLCYQLNGISETKEIIILK